ncbi:hypothetical protein LZZ90_08990 [Flavobacterium sp. SM15]|uniref:DUF6056 family protein n=1 Tax=Flavobacterium sp. SM15 TaxID=2908005 RepID=UPI001EDC008E|nr:DUF6056 family protein [Flavobacterium sp. SM15]MCG2611641.1 hypothetical protein [Flavobacterium sp. SM15]
MMTHFSDFKNNIYNAISFFGFLIICLILSLNLLTFYWADDYSVFNEINNYGIFNRCLRGYFVWDGRYMTPAGFLQGLFLSSLPAELITLFWTICFLTSGLIIYFILNKNEGISAKNSKTYFLPILIVIAFWLGSYRHIGQTIYWATGGVYSFNLVLGSFWILLFNRLEKVNSSVQRISFIAFTIVVSLTTQNLTIALITIVFLKILSDFLFREKQNLRINIFILLIIIAGTVFLSTAPGNFLRAKELNDSALSNVSILNLVKNYFFILYSYLKFSALIIILAIFSTIVWVNNYSILNFKNFASAISLPKSKVDWANFINNYKYLIAALSTILPFVALPEIVSTRTAIYFMFFLFLFIVEFLKNIPISRPATTKSFIPLFTLIVYFSATCFITYNLKKGSVLKTKMTEREQLLQKSKGKAITIRPIDESLKSYCFDLRDYNNNDDWALEAQEEYFGIQNITVK